MPRDLICIGDISVHLLVISLQAKEVGCCCDRYDGPSTLPEDGGGVVTVVEDSLFPHIIVCCFYCILDDTPSKFQVGVGNDAGGII